MIDPATSWLEVAPIRTKEAIEVANVIEKTWLTWYPWPQKLNYDRGSKFMAEFTDMVKNDYGINTKPITAKIHRLML